MKVVFFGTADFGLPALESIRASSQHSLVGVVTGPDKPRGRGRALSPTPIATALEESEFQPILKPERLDDPEFVARLRMFGASGADRYSDHVLGG